MLKFKEKIVLLHTDGYSIDFDDSFLSLDDARKEMQRQYDENIPGEGLMQEWKDMSFLSIDDATLYANGEDVHVWRIITV